MSKNFVQAAVKFGPKGNEDDRRSAINQYVANVSQGSEIVLYVFDYVEANHSVKVLPRGEGFRLHAIGLSDVHVRASGAQSFKVIQVERVYVRGPIDRTRHKVD